MVGVDLAELSITSGGHLLDGDGPADAFRLDDVSGVSVVPKPATGKKCARSWKIMDDVGTVPGFPDLTPRDAAAVIEFDARRAGRG
jgi:isoleucyl-tRNA synthetase